MCDLYPAFRRSCFFTFTPTHYSSNSNITTNDSSKRERRTVLFPQGYHDSRDSQRAEKEQGNNPAMAEFAGKTKVVFVGNLVRAAPPSW